MKLKHIFGIIALAATAFVACEKPVDLGPEKLVLDSESSIEIPIEGGEFTLDLTATLDWGIQGYDEDVQAWLSINPSEGKAAAEVQKITVSVLPNDDVDRTASLVFYGNVLCKAPLTITQKGPKGDGQNITVAEFLQKKDTETEYTLTGVIGDIATSDSYYGFSLKDDTGVVSCPFPLNFSDFEFHTGDKVSIKGKYEYYDKKQQDQLADGQILSHEPASASEVKSVTVAEFIEKADKFSLYRLSGTVSSSVNTQYCSFDLTDDTGTIVVWTVNNAAEWKDKVTKGGKVTLRGAYTLYTNANSGEQKHEVVDAYIESFEAGEGGGDGGNADQPTNLTEVTIAEFITKPVNETDWYKLTGKITEIQKETYGNFVIQDETGSVLIYGMTSKWVGKNDQSFSELGLKVGDTVTLGTLRAEYNGTAQGGGNKIPAFYISHVPGEGGGDDGGDGGDQGGIQKPTSATKVSVNEFLGKSVNTSDWYELTGTITSINGAEYGNFYIEDETGKVYIYGLTKAWAGGENDKSFSQIGLAVGDKVTIWTLRAEYNGTAQGGGSDCPALYISHVKGEAPTYPEGSVVLTFPDDNKDNNKVNGYDEPWVAKSGSNEFKVTAFNNYEWNNWTYIRCGRKAAASVASIATQTAIAPKITKLVLTLDKITVSDVNSIVTTVYSDAALTQKVCEISPDGTLAAGDVTFTVPEASRAANLYYETKFDCKTSSSSKNGFVQVSKLVYFAE